LRLESDCINVIILIVMRLKIMA